MWLLNKKAKKDGKVEEFMIGKNFKKCGEEEPTKKYGTCIEHSGNNKRTNNIITRTCRVTLERKKDFILRAKLIKIMGMEKED